MSLNTKIEWTDATWNPVTGCEHGCEYCYAKDYARRFGGYWLDGLDEEYIPGKVYDPSMGIHGMDCEPIEERDLYARLPYRTKAGKMQSAVMPFGFAPTMHRYRLDVPKHWREPRTIFVGSMCDLFGDWVPVEWIKAVFDACAAAPQHRYIFLTKNPKRYTRLYDEMPKGNRFYYGYSKEQGEISGFRDDINSFVSIEPLLGEVVISPLVHLNWIIIGAETGDRKGKVTPKQEWIAEILAYSARTNTPVFMKDSLLPIVGEENMRRDFPW